MDLFCLVCFMFVFVMLSCLFLAALLSPAGKGLISCVFFVLCFSCVFVTFPYGVPGQVWFLMISIHDICLPIYFVVYSKTSHYFTPLPQDS